MLYNIQYSIYENYYAQPERCTTPFHAKHGLIKRILRVCLFICAILVVSTTYAFAEAVHGALILDESQLSDPYRTPYIELEQPQRNPIIELETTPELGDSSIATAALVGLAGLALTGAVVAHKKSRSNAQ